MQPLRTVHTQVGNLLCIQRSIVVYTVHSLLSMLQYTRHMYVRICIILKKQTCLDSLCKSPTTIWLEFAYYAVQPSTLFVHRWEAWRKTRQPDDSTDLVSSSWGHFYTHLCSSMLWTLLLYDTNEEGRSRNSCRCESDQTHVSDPTVCLAYSGMDVLLVCVPLQDVCASFLSRLHGNVTDMSVMRVWEFNWFMS